MEHVVLDAHRNISAMVSLFGVPAFDKPISVRPGLHILGENDPIVEFRSMKERFEQSGNKDIHLMSYPDEGHWFRNSKNLKSSIKAIVSHYCRNGGFPK